jgi:hypothetical protein
MEFWCETHCGVGQHRDSSVRVELPSDDWTWCANPIEHRRLPRGFSRRVADIIGHFSRKVSVHTSQYRICSREVKGEHN